MNSSIKSRVLELLTARFGREHQPLIEKAMDELEALSTFQYVWLPVSKWPDFLQKEPYLTFFRDCDSFYLVATSLGWKVEKRIAQLQLLDLTQAFYFDQAAGLYLEGLADEFEKELAQKKNQQLTMRFCPGYSKSDYRDNRFILQALKPKGIELSSSFLLRPSKSMAGIVGIKRNHYD